MKDHSKRALVCLALIVGVGAGFRFYGLRVGFPFETHVDEWFIIDTVREMYATGSLAPRAFDYPSLVYYLLLACAHVVGLFREPTLYDLYVCGRVISALAGTATILVVYLTGRRAYNLKVGLLAAAFFACTVTALREAHYYTTDSINLLCITLAVYFIVKVGMGDSPWNYLKAGACVGLSAGSKYNGLFLSVPFLFAHVARVWCGADVEALKDFAGRLREFSSRFFSRWPFAAIFAALAAFLATTPYALITSSIFLKDLRKMSTALGSRIGEGNQHYLGTTPYLYYVENLLFWAMGPLLEAACLAGLVYALVRRRRQDIIIVLWVAVYFAVVGGWLSKAVRYTLPLLPFLTIFGAVMFVEGARYFNLRGRRRPAAVVVALASLTLASAFLYSLAYMNIYAQPHSYTQAVRWAFAKIPEGSTILLEGPTPHERPQPDGAKLVYDDSSFDFGARRFRFKFLEVPKFSRRDDDPAPLRAELNAALDGADYIVMSTRWYEGLVNSPEASTVIRDYYRALVGGGTSDFELVREIIVRPRIFGCEVDDDASELNFRVFDHPKVWIFRRKNIASKALNRSTEP